MGNDTELTGLIVKIKADLTEYQSKLDAMQGQTARASANVASKFDAMGASIAKAGIAMGAFAATAVNSAMTWGSAVNKLAKQTGMSAEESSKFLVIAKKASIDTDTASMMYAKLAKSINSATIEQSVANATGKISSDIFTQLGVKTLDVNGNMRKSSDIFADIKDKLAGMQNGWQKTAIEMEIFGRTGYQLNGLINMTSVEMKDAIDMAQSLGLILDDKTAPAWAKLSKEIKAAKGILSSTGITLGNELMPMFKEVINDITAVTKAFTGMNPEVRSSIIQIATLAGEFGITTTILNRSLGAIGGVTEALGVMKVATLTAAGPWIALAGAISYAIYMLGDYQAKNRDWRGQQAALDSNFTPADIKEGIQNKVTRRKAGMSVSEASRLLISPAKEEPENPFIPYGAGSGQESKGKEKTDLQKYLEQLKDVEDILTRQFELGERNKDQVKATLEAQLQGLKNVVVGQEEQLDKERAIYDLKSKLRQIEHDQIDTAKAKADRDFAAQTITETQYFEQRKKQIQDEINLEAEGSTKRYDKEKALQDLINSNNEKMLSRTLSQISVDQAYASANLKIEAEQLRHKQAMAKIGDWQGDTLIKLQAAKDAEQAIVDAQYNINLEAIDADIKMYMEAGEKKTKELEKAFEDRKVLTQKYNNDTLVLDNSLAEKQKQLEQNKIDANNATIAALITGTKSGHDVLKDMWFKFVDQIVAKMFSISAETNIFTQLLGGLLGGKSVANTGQFTSGGQLIQGPVLQDGSFISKREFGGPVKAGQPYIVGEKRPELFIPDRNGIIMPNLNMLGRSNGNYGGGATSTGDTSIKIEINPTFQSLDPAAGQAMFKAQIPQMLTAVEVALREKTSMKNAAKQAVK